MEKLVGKLTGAMEADKLKTLGDTLVSGAAEKRKQEQVSVRRG